MSESIRLLYKPLQFVGVAPKIRRNCFRYLYRPNEKSQRHRILSRIMARLVESQISDGNFLQIIRVMYQTEQIYRRRLRCRR